MKSLFKYIIPAGLTLLLLSSCGIGKMSSTLNVKQPPGKETPPESKDAEGAPKSQEATSDNGLSSTMIAAGGDTTCAVDGDANGYCWGKNDLGQTGNKVSKTKTFGPQSIVTGASKVISMSLGNTFSCLLNNTNILKCWGDNSNMQLGISDASVTSTPVPTIVSPKYSAKVKEIGGLWNSVCFLLTNGTVECIGNIQDNRIGITAANIPNNLPITGTYTFKNEKNEDWSTSFTSVPLTVPNMSGIKLKEMTETRFGIGEDGKKYCFGSSSSLFCKYEPGKFVGQLLDINGSQIKSLTRTSSVWMFLTEANELYTFGSNLYGTLGNKEVSKTEGYATSLWSKPYKGVEYEKVQIKALAEVSSVALETGCVITQDGGVQCLGRNFGGMLGNGNSTMVFSESLSEVIDESKAPLKNVTKVQGGNRNICALKEDTSLWCWGQNGLGVTLGVNKPEYPRDASVPFAVKVIDSGVKDFYVSDQAACALTDDNSLKCWGIITRGMLGTQIRAHTSVPTEIIELKNNVKAIQKASSILTMCVITMQDRVACLGETREGLAGPWAPQSYAEATGIYRQKTFTYLPFYGGFDNSTKVSAGDAHACIVSGGAARCWGANDKGQLGNGTKDNSAEPNYVHNVFGQVKDMALGAAHSCFLENSGKVKCTGDNSKGQLGQVSMDSSSLPLVISMPEDIETIGSGKNHMCAVSKTGLVYCWGNNTGGQIGDKTFNRRSSPVQVSGIKGRAVMVVGGENHTCVLLEDGGVNCWGDNQFGQLGIGNAKPSLVPVAVSDLKGRVVSITAGSNHTCAVTAEDKSYCWGKNTENQLGNNNSNSSFKPVLVELKK